MVKNSVIGRGWQVGFNVECAMGTIARGRGHTGLNDIRGMGLWQVLAVAADIRSYSPIPDVERVGDPILIVRTTGWLDAEDVWIVRLHSARSVAEAIQRDSDLWELVHPVSADNDCDGWGRLTNSPAIG